VPVAQ